MVFSGGACHWNRRDQPEIPESLDATQNWGELDGARAFHLIERHGEGWADVGAKMDVWAIARHGQSARQARGYPEAMTPALSEVLSLMLWHTGNIARALRAGGVDIKTRAEDEQAHVLHWLIQLALDHGDAWWDRACDRLREIQEAVRAGKEA